MQSSANLFPLWHLYNFYYADSDDADSDADFDDADSDDANTVADSDADIEYADFANSLGQSTICSLVQISFLSDACMTFTLLPWG